MGDEESTYPAISRADVQPPPPASTAPECSWHTSYMRRAAVTGLTFALLAGLIAAGAGLGYRWELWSFRAGFTILRWAAYASLAAAALSLVGAMLALRHRSRRGLLPGVAGLVLGLAIASVPFAHLLSAREVPPIHDISTDTRDPPTFVAIRALRAGAPNSPDYAGAAVAEQQHRAYPDIAPVVLALPPDQAFTKALAAAKALGWRIVAAVPGQGRIEATDRTFWFGFTDDVVVRVRRGTGGSVVDVRSVSRVGRSDTGTNANRIRRFIRELTR